MADDKTLLVVVSKLKSHIKDTAGLNTSGDVPEVLTKIVMDFCDQACEAAKSDGRKTLMARDFTSIAPK